MRSGHPRAKIAVAVAFGLSLVAPHTTDAVGASEAALAVFDGFTASQSIYIEPRSNAVFALPAHQLVGATHAEINSQPRAQGYAATWGVPLAQNARGVGIPVDYYGQCYANYPGEPKVECGIPFSEDPPPNPPSDGPFSGSAFKAHAEASGADGAPDTTRASGITEAGGMAAGDTLRIGWSRSESKSYVEGAALHAVTASAAQDITVAGVLHIGSVEARAETVHPGSLTEATGTAETVMQNVTVAGTPVTIGPAGLMVQGQPVGEAPEPVSKPILDAMDSQGMTIEPLPAPRISRDENTGLIEAATDGFRILLQSPNGDAKFEMVFGRALARAGAVRTADDTPLDLSGGVGEPVAADSDPPVVPTDTGVPTDSAVAAGPAAPEDPAVAEGSGASPAPIPAGGLGESAGHTGTGAAPGDTGTFAAFDPVAGSVAPLDPAPDPGPAGSTAPAAPAPAPPRAQLAAQPAASARDLSSRVLTTYAAVFGVVLAGSAFALGRRPQRFGGSV